MSVRVVNLGSAGVDDQHARLSDDVDEVVQPPPTSESISSPRSSPLRGTTLGLLGPDNLVRLAMYKFLLYP